MKKTIAIILMLIMMCFVLTGCVKREDREGVLKTLKKEDYIKSDWELIDETTDDALFGTNNYLYVYEDRDNKLFAVVINTDSKDEEKLYVSLYENTVQEKILKSDNTGEYNYIYERGNLVEDLVLEKGSFGWKIKEK